MPNRKCRLTRVHGLGLKAQAAPRSPSDNCLWPATDSHEGEAAPITQVSWVSPHTLINRVGRVSMWSVGTNEAGAPRVSTQSEAEISVRPTAARGGPWAAPSGGDLAS